MFIFHDSPGYLNKNTLNAFDQSANSFIEQEWSSWLKHQRGAQDRLALGLQAN
jgi:hypothetical protein